MFGIRKTRTVAQGRPEPSRAAHVVGADGHRSVVRAALGQPFPGVSVIESLFLADVRLADKPDGVLTVNGAGDPFAMIASFGDGWYLVYGENDWSLPSDREANKELLPAAAFTQVPGADHFIALERPDLLAELLNASA
jgi:2-polyprenyl-6-methoxyphenol hydroxylase-like FAD-dependent oxidoreductase